MPQPSPSNAALRRLVVGCRWMAMRQRSGVSPDAWRDRGLAGTRLHDVYADEVESDAVAIGFSLAFARAAGTLPVLWILIGGDRRQSRHLHAGGLIEFGVPPAALVLVAADKAGGMKAAAEAARCGGLGMVVVQSQGPAPEIDLTATRRLMLAAAEGGTTVLNLRIGAPVTPSAAWTRWRVGPSPSRALATGAPGLPAFEIECLRQRGGLPGAPARVEWNRETRSFVDAPLAGAGLSLAAGGAVAGHPPAFVRGTG